MEKEGNIKVVNQNHRPEEKKRPVTKPKEPEKNFDRSLPSVKPKH